MTARPIPEHRGTPGRTRAGFTLIEVMGALVIFSVGVLMTLNMSDIMSRRLDRAALQSELMARARTVADSVSEEGFGSLAPGTRTSTLAFRGRAYEERVVVVRLSPLVLEARVTLEPAAGEQGPSYEMRSSVAGPW